MDITEVKPCPFCGEVYRHNDDCYIVSLLEAAKHNFDPEYCEHLKLDEKFNIRFVKKCRNVAEIKTNFECSSCGTQYWDTYEVNYCPACGKKVEKYRED